MGIKKYTGLAIITAIILCVLTVSMACGTPATENGQSEETGGQKSSLTEEQVKQIEEAIAEEEADTTDYGSVSAGAELYGYMPSYLCTDTDNYVKVEVTNTSDFTWRARGEEQGKDRISLLWAGCRFC